MQVAPDQNTHDLVGRPLPMTSALKQASGEAVFIDDLPPMAGQYYTTNIEVCSDADVLGRK